MFLQSKTLQQLHHDLINPQQNTIPLNLASTHNREQAALRRLALIQEHILRAPEGGVKAAHNKGDDQRNQDIQAHLSEHQCHHRDQAQRHQNEAVIHDSAQGNHRVVAAEVEEKPAYQYHQEDDHGDGVVDEAAEEDNEGN